MMVGVDDALGGDRRALARLLSLIEEGGDAARQAMARLYPHTGRAHVVGVTGPPGSGKSVLISRLAHFYRQRGMTVGIVAVDPSSPLSGGALLGDRVRMGRLSGDAGVFIRSMASRGGLGGLARATADIVQALDACGFQRILIETVGAGQNEVDVAHIAHTTLVLQAPGMGDEVQALKAGILEIADVLVVNKADQPGADHTIAMLRAMLDLVEATPSWQTPVLKTVATQGEGILEVVDAIERHMAYLTCSGERERRERRRIADELEAILREDVMRKTLDRIGPERYSQMIDRVFSREMDPYTAVQRLLSEW